MLCMLCESKEVSDQTTFGIAQTAKNAKSHSKTSLGSRFSVSPRGGRKSLLGKVNRNCVQINRRENRTSTNQMTVTNRRRRGNDARGTKGVGIASGTEQLKVGAKRVR